MFQPNWLTINTAMAAQRHESVSSDSHLHVMMGGMHASTNRIRKAICQICTRRGFKGENPHMASVFKVGTLRFGGRGSRGGADMLTALDKIASSYPINT